MLVLITGIVLILLGLWIILAKKNIIRMIIGFTIMDTGINLLIVAIGYVRKATAPILDGGVATQLMPDGTRAVLDRVADPVPSALVLTAIVIGLAVTALMLSFAIRLFKARGSLNIDDYEEQKW